MQTKIQLKKNSQSKRAHKVTHGKTTHLCLGPKDEDQPSKKKMKLVVESYSLKQDSNEEEGRASKYQPKVLGRVLERMKECKAIVGKGMQTQSSSKY